MIDEREGNKGDSGNAVTVIMATKFYIWKCLFLETSIFGRFYISAYPTKTFHPQNLPKKAYSVNPYL